MWSASVIPNALPSHILAETFERHLRGLLRGVRALWPSVPSGPAWIICVPWPWSSRRRVWWTADSAGTYGA